MKYSKKLTTVLMLLWGLNHPSLAIPSINELFGKWEVDGYMNPQTGIYCFNEATYQSMAGKQIEFRAKYLVIDGKQYHHPRYLCHIRSFEEFTEDWPYEMKSKQGPVMTIVFEAYAGYEFQGRSLLSVTIDQDQLIMLVNDYMLTLKRCPDPPFLHRLGRYIKALCSWDSYDPCHEVPAAMFGKWEIYRKERDAWNEDFSEAEIEQCIGKQIELRPRYLIIDGVQYNKPRYWREIIYWYGSKVQYESVQLDRYNDYQLLGKTFTKYDFFKMFHDELRMRLKVVDFWLRRCPEPSWLERLTCYMRSLLGIHVHKSPYPKVSSSLQRKTLPK